MPLQPLLVGEALARVNRSASKEVLLEMVEEYVDAAERLGEQLAGGV